MPLCRRWLAEVGFTSIDRADVVLLVLGCRSAGMHPARFFRPSRLVKGTGRVRAWLSPEGPEDPTDGYPLKRWRRRSKSAVPAEPGSGSQLRLYRLCRVGAFRVLNTVPCSTDWQLQLRFPRIQEVTLYQPSPDASGARSFIVKQAGSLLPMSQWESSPPSSHVQRGVAGKQRTNILFALCQPHDDAAAADALVSESPHRP